MADPLDDYTSRLFQIESGGNPNAVTGKNRGLGQFGPDEEAKYGLNDQNRNDPKAQAEAVAKERGDLRNALYNVLGREPTNAEYYLAHQQGIAGGPALLGADPSKPAWEAIRPYYKSDAVAQRAIWGNMTPQMKAQYPGGVTTVPAGGFVSGWGDRFNGVQPTQVAQVSPVSPPPQTAPQVVSPGLQPPASAGTLPSYPTTPVSFPQAQASPGIPQQSAPQFPQASPIAQPNPLVNQYMQAAAQQAQPLASLTTPQMRLARLMQMLS